MWCSNKYLKRQVQYKRQLDLISDVKIEIEIIQIKPDTTFEINILTLGASEMVWSQTLSCYKVKL